MPGNSAFTLDTMVRFIADEQSIAAVNRSISTIKNFARIALGAIGVGFSLRELNRITESYRSMKNEMAAVFGSTEDLAAVQEKIKKTARDVSGEYERIADNVTTLVKNNKRVFDVDTATRFTDVMWKLTKMSGGDNASASSAVQSLSSAMKNGKIDRGAIDQLINNVPQAVKVLTSYYGVTQERLRSMAQAGLIRSAQVRDAFLRAGEDIDKAFSDVQMNITDVLSSCKSEFAAFIGETDEMLGITKTLSKILKDGFDFLMKGLQKARSGLIWLSDKLGGMENVLKLLVILAGSFFVAFHLKDIITGLTNILGLFTKLGLKGMALVATIALIALLVDDFYHFMKGDKKSFFGDLFEAKGLDSGEIKKKIQETLGGISESIRTTWENIVKWTSEHWDDIVTTITGVFETISGIIGEATEVVQSFFNGIKTWWDESGAEQVGDSIDRLKESIVTSMEAIKEWWDQHGEEVKQYFEHFGESLGKAFGDTIEAISYLFKTISDILSGDSDAAWEDWETFLTKLGEIVEDLFDAIFGTDFADQAGTLGENLIESFVNGITDKWEEIKEKIYGIPEDIKKTFGVGLNEEETKARQEEYSTVEKVFNGINKAGELLAEAGKKSLPLTPLRMLYDGINWAGKKLNFWSDDIADANAAMSSGTSLKTAEYATSNSNNRTQNNDINITNNMYGDAATKNVYDKITSATEDNMDTITRSLVAANG